jgi:hypothetical protein
MSRKTEQCAPNWHNTGSERPCSEWTPEFRRGREARLNSAFVDGSPGRPESFGRRLLRLLRGIDPSNFTLFDRKRIAGPRWLRFESMDRELVVALNHLNGIVVRDLLRRKLQLNDRSTLRMRPFHPNEFSFETSMHLRCQMWV